tara:strand:+ start:378 stop:881 length:504 start_codon:yes stop_codon:yes gene_type:complete
MKLLFNQKQIDKSVSIIAERLSKDMGGNDTPSVFVGLLNGGFMFFSDLTKQITHPIECDFLRVKSYSGKKQGDISILKDLETPIKGKDVYIVDDFYDSGKTMDTIVEYLELKKPNSIKVVTLLTRDFSPVPKVPSYFGFLLKDEWVCGYGMDDSKGYMRNNPNIYEI